MYSLRFEEIPSTECDDNIKVYLKKEEKEAFKKLAKKECIPMSVLLRDYILTLVQIDKYNEDQIQELRHKRMLELKEKYMNN